MLAQILEQDRLIVNAKGVPCPREKCERAGQEQWRSDEKVLGRRCVAKGKAEYISLRSVFHRCRSCGIKQSICICNPLFEGIISQGSLGMTPAVCSFWNCVEGVSITQTARQLNISAQSVALLYERCYEVMAMDAVYLQSQIEWGSDANATVDIELDCLVMAHLREVVSVGVADPVADPVAVADPAADPAADPVPDGVEMCYSYYVWMGAGRRGDCSALFTMPCGISTTFGHFSDVS